MDENQLALIYPEQYDIKENAEFINNIQDDQNKFIKFNSDDVNRN